VGEQGPEVAAANPGDVRLEVLVAGDGDLAAVILPGADLAEAVVAGEVGVGVVGQDAAAAFPPDPGGAAGGPPAAGVLSAARGGGREGDDLADDFTQEPAEHGLSRLTGVEGGGGWRVEDRGSRIEDRRRGAGSRFSIFHLRSSILGPGQVRQEEVQDPPAVFFA